MRLSALVLLGCALLLTGCARLNLFQRNQPTLALPADPRIGMPAPDIEGEDFEGNRFKLSDYRGKVVVVSFWGSWCGPCHALIPHERALVERYQDKKFVLLGVNMDTDRTAAMNVVASRGITWRNWHAGGEGSQIKRRWPVAALPTIYVLDADGVIRYVRNSCFQLENSIDTLLAEAESKAN